jgi:hypothetical protein
VAESSSETKKGSSEREVAARLWPQHAEMCSEHDWAVLAEAVKTDKPINDRIVEPVGEAKDAILASLMILYWTMKLTRLAIQISHEVSGLHGKAKAEAMLKAVTNRMDINTPEMVSSKVHEVIDALS